MWPEGIKRTRSLNAGDVIRFERQALCVHKIQECPRGAWPNGYVALWYRAGMPSPDEWADRPMLVTGAWHAQSRSSERVHVLTSGDYRWEILPEDYAVCSSCGEVPPCRHMQIERAVREESERLREILSINPGHCHACLDKIREGEPFIAFSGMNLLRPDLGPGSAIFHEEGRCRWKMKAYEELWWSSE
jgi:hypothetical protein